MDSGYNDNGYMDSVYMDSGYKDDSGRSLELQQAIDPSKRSYLDRVLAAQHNEDLLPWATAPPSQHGQPGGTWARHAASSAYYYEAHWDLGRHAATRGSLLGHPGGMVNFLRQPSDDIPRLAGPTESGLGGRPVTPMLPMGMVTDDQLGEAWWR